MIPAAFEYARATTLDEASAKLAALGEEAKVIAGGQSLIPLMRMRLSQPTALVDISRIAGLDRIHRENGTLVVGALARHADIARSDTVREALPLLAEMAHEVGDSQVRNLGTIGGVVSHGDSAGDYNALAVMLDAEIITTRRRHAAPEFFRDLLTTALEPGEIVTEVRFPVATGAHAYLKFRRRLYDWAIAGVAVQRREAGWRVGYVSLGSTPRRGRAVEAALARMPLAGDAAAECGADIDPTADLRGSVAYKRHLAEVLTARALRQAQAAA
jgi:carbon-monoxide dehydrogenase medium subunit